MIAVEFDERGLYFVKCPDCADAREDYTYEHAGNPAWLSTINDGCPCKLCRNSGDLCTTIEIERDTTPEQLASMVAKLRAELR